MFCGSLYGRGIWERMDTLYLWLNSLVVNLILSQHGQLAISSVQLSRSVVSGYTPIQNKILKKKVKTNNKSIYLSIHIEVVMD